MSAGIKYTWTHGETECDRKEHDFDDECEECHVIAPASLVPSIFTVDCGDFMGLSDDMAERIAHALNALGAHGDLLRGVRLLSSAMDLGDLIYRVREKEGLGWDGPLVKAWSDGCVLIRDVLAKAKQDGEII